MAKPIAVTAAVIIHNERIFCARRAAHKPMAGYWEFPGGKVEANESFVGCLQRELQEEFAIQTRVDKYLMSNQHHYPQLSICLYAYRVSLISGDFVCRDHDQTYWLPAQELKQLKWSPADIPVVDYLMKMNKP